MNQQKNRERERERERKKERERERERASEKKMKTKREHVGHTREIQKKAFDQEEMQYCICKEHTSHRPVWATAQITPRARLCYILEEMNKDATRSQQKEKSDAGQEEIERREDQWKWRCRWTEIESAARKEENGKTSRSSKALFNLIAVGKANPNADHDQRKRK